MKLKNYQEDIVLNLIDIALKDYPDIVVDELFIHDVAAYTLNRIPPKYIMSERGFTRFASTYLIEEDEDDANENLIELMIIIKLAIEHLYTRRKTNRPEVKEELVPGYNEYIHNFPQLIGKVLDKETLKPVIGAEVTLSINKIKAQSAEAGWPNPYSTNQPTKGYFSFWPKPVIDVNETQNFKLELSIEHDSYQSFTCKEKIVTKGTFYKNELFESDKIIKLSPCLLNKIK